MNGIGEHWVSSATHPGYTDTAAAQHTRGTVLNGYYPSSMAVDPGTAVDEIRMTRERVWVKYDGAGPIDEAGMPIASRPSVNKPRDWYRRMFRHIHSRPTDDEFEAADVTRPLHSGSHIPPRPLTEVDPIQGGPGPDPTQPDLNGFTD
uniref:sorbin and SH3 domain-containing protein 2-like n=1 Tax=Pristiophorus japonicus TaxID=55135 RepID=UPI00398F2918